MNIFILIDIFNLVSFFSKLTFEGKGHFKIFLEYQWWLLQDSKNKSNNQKRNSESLSDPSFNFSVAFSLGNSLLCQRLNAKWLLGNWELVDIRFKTGFQYSSILSFDLSTKPAIKLWHEFQSPLNLRNFYWQNKVHILWEGHKILRNLPLTFDCMYCSQK